MEGVLLNFELQEELSNLVILDPPLEQKTHVHPSPCMVHELPIFTYKFLQKTDSNFDSSHCF